jgi:regulator of RNase E activity RraA
LLCRSAALSRTRSFKLKGASTAAGDAIIGDQDGVVVVPAAVAQEVYDIAHSREVIEGIIKEQLEKEKCPPGKYYPFVSGKIKVNPPPSPS